MIEKLQKINFLLKQTKPGRFIIQCTKAVGLFSLMHRIRARYQAKNFPQGMLESRNYFGENKERVNTVVSWLADEESKQTYLDIIEFRGSYDIKKARQIPKYQQYLPTDFFIYKQREVFIDCGAENGDSIRAFKRFAEKMRRGGNTYKIVAFEPNPKWCRIIEREHKDCTVFNCGVWSADTTLSFCGETMMSVAAGTEAENPVTLPVKAIDNLPECSEATYIKMDIEGAELPALKGAEKTILRNKPKLAVSIYHSDEDMLQIAEWIHRKLPEYKLYVRHHHKYGKYDTVLYATV